MDKAQLIELAPYYYALAVIRHLQAVRQATTLEDIAAQYDLIEPDSRAGWNGRLHNMRFLQKSVKILQDAGVLLVEKDYFGPTLIIPTSGLTSISPDDFESLPDLAELYGRFSQLRAKQREEWLGSALDKLALESQRLGISENDFEYPGHEWSPIPLDRAVPETQAMIEAAEQLSADVRASNGYAASKPEERSYVLDGLAVFRARLAAATSISLPYIRQYAIEPMLRLSKSFAGSAVALAAEVLKARIKDWLAKQSIPWPADWF